jgi:hypothetical protein
MAKKDRINGIPNVLIQQYFSTLFYSKADWIWNAANDKNVSDIKIDIIKETIIPKELQIQELTGGLCTLRQTIKKELENNGFSEDFIKKAQFEIYITPAYKNDKFFGVIATLEDKDGNIYRSKPYIEKAYETFQVFKSTSKETIIPRELQIQELTGGLCTLRQTIKKELENNGFSEDFIKKAQFEIYIIPKNDKYFGVSVTLEAKNGNIYRSKVYIEKTYGTFQVFKSTLLKKINKIFNIKSRNIYIMELKNNM